MNFNSTHCAILGVVAMTIVGFAFNRPIAEIVTVDGILTAYAAVRETARVKSGK